MKRTLSKIILVILVLLMIVPNAVMATDIKKNQNKLNNLDKNMKNIEKKIEDSKGDQQDTKKEIEELEHKLAEANRNLEKTKAELNATNQSLEKAKKELSKAKEALEEQNITLSERIRVMYKSGNIGYLEVLLEAKSFSDLITRLDIIKTIMEYDFELLNTLEEKKSEVEVKKQNIEKEQQRILALKNQLESKANQVKSIQTSRQNHIRKLDDEIAAFEKEMKHLEEDSTKVKKLIQQAQAAAKKNNSNNSNNSNNQGNSNPYTGGSIAWPVPASSRITSPYGMRMHPIDRIMKMHTGIDIGAGTGTPVIASSDGVVTYTGYLGGYGYTVIIDIGGGLSTLAAHNSKLLVSAGQSVKKGQTVALVGSTGASTGPHSHFEVRVNGNHTNPIPYLR